MLFHYRSVLYNPYAHYLSFQKLLLNSPSLTPFDISSSILQSITYCWHHSPVMMSFNVNGTTPITTSQRTYLYPKYIADHGILAAVGTVLAILTSCFFHIKNRREAVMKRVCMLPCSRQVIELISFPYRAAHWRDWNTGTNGLGRSHLW